MVRLCWIPISSSVFPDRQLAICALGICSTCSRSEKKDILLSDWKLTTKCLYCSLRWLCKLCLSGWQIWMLHRPCKTITTAPNIQCIVCISSDLQIRGADLIELASLLPVHKWHRLSETQTELECFVTDERSWRASLAADSQCCLKCCVSGSQAAFRSAAAQPSLGQGAGLFHICSLSDGKEHKSVPGEMRQGLSVSATASMFSPLGLCLLREGSICTSCFWRAELCYCSLNGEYAESEHLSETMTGKISLLPFKNTLGRLFVSSPDYAGFIYMRLLMISLFCKSHQTNVFCVPSTGSAADIH